MIPVSLFIMGMPYTVVFRTEAEMETSDFLVISSKKLQLQMRSGLCPSRERGLLLYAVIHQITDYFGWDDEKTPPNHIDLFSQYFGFFLCQNNYRWAHTQTTHGLPDEIKLGISTWKIIKDDDSRLTTGEMGICYFDNHEIVIRSNLVPYFERMVLLHELVHAISYMGNCQWFKDETMIRPFTAALRMFLDQNNTDWITEDFAK
jgi:hypothetical protein